MATRRRTPASFQVLLLQPHLGYPRDTPAHPWHELVVVLRGDYQVLVAGGRLALAPGDAILYPAGLEHRPQPGDGRSLTTVCVMWTSAEDLGATPLVARDPSQRLAQAATWLYDLHRRPGASAAAAGLFAALRAELRHRAAANTEPDPITRLHALLAANPGRDQHLPNLAAITGLSPTHLTRLFKARYGLTPMQHLRRLRLEAALTLIRDRRGTLAEIAAACGFRRATYLSRAVRRETGAPPRRLRGVGRADHASGGSEPGTSRRQARAARPRTASSSS